MSNLSNIAQDYALNADFAQRFNLPSDLPLCACFCL